MTQRHFVAAVGPQRQNYQNYPPCF